MPPRRRQNRTPDFEAGPAHQPVSPANEEDDGSPEETEVDGDDDERQSSQIPFYNTTFSAHRVSPLYLGAEALTASRLQLLAHRLRDKLVGDVVRGVEVGAADREDSIVGRAGALERVEISWVSVADVLGFSREDVERLQDEDDIAGWRRAARDLGEKRALHIALRYEMASCTALMLPSLLGDGNGEFPDTETRFWVGDADAAARERRSNPAHFLSLPLLLLRMPAPLKAVVGDFLATTFDCRVSPMRLGTRSLVGSWEAWIRSAGLPSTGALSKDAVLSLGFHVPAPSASPTQPLVEEDAASDQQQPLGLKSIDVIIPAAELRKFVAAGKQVVESQSRQTGALGALGWQGDLKQRRLLAGRLYEEGWEWRTASGEPGNSTDRQPFMEALACYLGEHLSLDLFHPGVRVIKVACGGFVMSESRLKVFEPVGAGDVEDERISSLGPRGAILELLGRLADKAQTQAVAG
ncbi:kinetochore complex Sim4 subunit Fta1-domain-containing protein [Thermothelomyces heterothallicus CBS 202.75]|uniref:kinetochore complex Sim4 subunit Fta1-domain-containing protein n=1 Tax=Thermothelomyces heterothallicus CBS 202.75 TaxID=1149848 RepID=UPI003743570A